MIKYIYAHDPIIQRRVVHMVEEGYAISMVTGHRFKLTKKELKNLESAVKGKRTVK